MNEPFTLTLNKRLFNLAVALALFALLYTLTNAYADALYHYQQQDSAQQAHSYLWPKTVHSLDLPVDKSIPFIAEMIVPYSWSLVLFCASFFMVQTVNQLTLLTRRLVLSTVLACLIFYLFPARFSFIRPEISNWTQIGYQFLNLTDKPFNQFPSLHVTYAIVLGVSLWPVAKLRDFQGWLSKLPTFRIIYRVCLSIVCSFIIISTVFTYQHHLIDILGGILLASVVLRLSSKLRNNLVLKYIAVAIAGFIVIAITGFNARLYFDSVLIEVVLFAGAIYWLGSFLAIAYVYQIPSQQRLRRWFAKDEFGQLTLGSWARFAPLLTIYWLMNRVGQIFENFRITAKSDNDRPSAVCFLERPDHYRISDEVYGLATAKLSMANLQRYWTIYKGSYQNSDYNNNSRHQDTSNLNIAHIVVIDVVAELSSHIRASHFKGSHFKGSHFKGNHFQDSLTRAPIIGEGYKESSINITADNIPNTQAYNTEHTANDNYKLPTIHYIYFPLLDLQGLEDIKIEEWIPLFDTIDKVISRLIPSSYQRNTQSDSIETHLADRHHTSNISVSSHVVLNFQCAMGLSRSVAVHTLYMLYHGRLNRDSYKDWIQTHYPLAHMTSCYLPMSLVERVVDCNRLRNHSGKLRC